MEDIRETTKEEEKKFWEERLKMALGDKETRIVIQKILSNLEK
jgi:hypothetical protein